MVLSCTVSEIRRLMVQSAYFSYPSLIRRPHSVCSLWNFALKLTARKLESGGYPTVTTPWSSLEKFWHDIGFCWTEGRRGRRIANTARQHSLLLRRCLAEKLTLIMAIRNWSSSCMEIKRLFTFGWSDLTWPDLTVRQTVNGQHVSTDKDVTDHSSVFPILYVYTGYNLLHFHCTQYHSTRSVR